LGYLLALIKEKQKELEECVAFGYDENNMFRKRLHFGGRDKRFIIYLNGTPILNFFMLWSQTGRE